MKGNYRSIIVTTILSVCVLLGGLHNWFVGTGHRLDIFLFYDYPDGGRYISNILKDLSGLLTISIILFLFRKYPSYTYVRRAVTPFFWVSIIDIVDYILFFKQLSLIKLPILMAMIIYQYKRK